MKGCSSIFWSIICWFLFHIRQSSNEVANVLARIGLLGHLLVCLYDRLDHDHLLFLLSNEVLGDHVTWIVSFFFYYNRLVWIPTLVDGLSLFYVFTLFLRALFYTHKILRFTFYFS